MSIGMTKNTRFLPGQRHKYNQRVKSPLQFLIVNNPLASIPGKVKPSETHFHWSVYVYMHVCMCVFSTVWLFLKDSVSWK